MVSGLLSHDCAGLSHCRHMKKVRGMVAHMVDTSAPVQGENPANYRDGIVEELWTEFQANRNVSMYMYMYIQCICTCTLY